MRRGRSNTARRRTRFAGRDATLRDPSIAAPLRELFFDKPWEPAVRALWADLQPALVARLHPMAESHPLPMAWVNSFHSSGEGWGSPS